MEAHRTLSPLGLELRFSLLGGLADKGWELGFVLEVWNIYNRNNILEVRYSQNFYKRGTCFAIANYSICSDDLEF